MAEGVARIGGAASALLVALVAERGEVRVPMVGVVDPSGAWSEDPGAIRKILASVGGATDPQAGPGEWERWSIAIRPPTVCSSIR